MGVMDGNIVLVAGAARGVGKVAALGMARAWADVVVNDVYLLHRSSGATPWEPV